MATLVLQCTSSFRGCTLLLNPLLTVMIRDGALVDSDILTVHVFLHQSCHGIILYISDPIERHRAYCF